MCGFVLYSSTRPGFDETKLLAALEKVDSRGPDETGTLFFEKTAILHKRLSIIGLEDGKQPFSDSEKRFYIVYNGEIYNYRELKSELVEEGVNFSTKCDTEVVLKAYLQWGKECVNKFRGMFSFVIFDKKANTLFAARDHLGIKPLYFYYDRENIVLASELISIKELKILDFTISLDSINDFLCFQYIPAPKTIYKNIFKVEAGYCLEVDLNEWNFKSLRYWNIDFSEKLDLSSAELQKQFKDQFIETIRYHAVSDVEVGAFLSGGIDSSLVVKYLSELKPNLKTFSIGFDDKNFSELKFAQQVAKKYKTDHYVEVLDDTALDILPDLVQRYGEPFGDSSAIPTYFLSRLASKEVKVALSGDGADEIFAGYSSYQKLMRSKGCDFSWEKYVNYFQDYHRERIWKKDVLKSAILSEPYTNILKESETYSLLNRAQYSDIKLYLQNDILTKVDIASMMNSLEVRTPFVDKVFYEFGSSMPENMIYRKRFFSSDIGKNILKKDLSEDFGASFVFRKKKGFAVPLAKWLSLENEKYRKKCDDILNSSSVLFEIFNKSEVEKILYSRVTGHIWLILVLHEWFVQEGDVKYE